MRLKKIYKKRFKEKNKTYLYLLFFLPFLYLGIFFLRIKNDKLAFFNELYNQINIINNIREISFFTVIKDYFFNAENNLSIVNIIFSRFNIENNIMIILIILSSIIFLVFILILYYILINKIRGNHDLLNILSIFFLLISPIFISKSYFLSDQIFFMVIFLLSSISYLYKKYHLSYILLLFNLLLFNDPLLLILFFCFYLYYSISKIEKKNIKFYFYLILFLSLLLFLQKIYLFLKGDISFINNYSSYFFESGNLYGISFIMFFISLFAFFDFWFKNRKNFLFYLFSLFLFFITLLNHDYIFYLNFLIVYFALESFNIFNKKRWFLKFSKKAIFFMLIFLLIFSTYSYIDKVSVKYPSKDDVLALEYLKNNHHQGKIFTYSYNKPIILFFSNYSIFIEKNILSEKNLSFEKIIENRDLEKTHDFFTENNISYIYFNDLMYDKKLINEDSGILFLMKYSKIFKNIYNSDGIKIWKVERISENGDI